MCLIYLGICTVGANAANLFPEPFVQPAVGADPGSADAASALGQPQQPRAELHIHRLGRNLHRAATTARFG